MAFTVQVLHFKSPDPKVTAQWYVDNLGATITRERQILGGTTGYQLDLHGVPLLVTSLVGGSQKLEQFYGLEHIGLFTGDLDGFPRAVQGRRWPCAGRGASDWSRAEVLLYRGSGGVPDRTD